MMAGVEAITEGTLWDLTRGVYGAGDILVRSDNHPSDFGTYHYRVIEVKQSAEVKEHAKRQAGLLNQILGQLQGYTPPEFEIILEDESKETISQEEIDEDVNETLTLLEKLRDEADEPDRPGFGKGMEPWGHYCDTLLKEDLDVTSTLSLTPFNKTV